MTPVAGSVVLNFTSDPQIRYDRFTGRWYVSIIDVPVPTPLAPRQRPTDGC